jgi:putative DNA-invertase from lambdoid prophage Rac
MEAVAMGTVTTPRADGEPIKAAAWSRVSTADQRTENQGLREWAARRGIDVVAEYTVHDSAWKRGNGKGREFDEARARLLEGARQGEYQVVMVWALDRLSRRGYSDLGGFIEKLNGYGAELWSQQEQWLQTVGPFGEIVVHMLAWMAEQESRRRSERTKAGLARRREKDGLPVGRQPGAVDKAKRRRSGYVSAWEGEAGERRREALRARNRARAQGGPGEGT